MVHRAVRPTEGPVLGQHVHKVEARVERDGEEVGNGQVEQVPVHYVAHQWLGGDDPDDEQVATGRQQNHGVEEH